MNDELKNKSVEILTQIQQAVQSGAEVTGQQLPDIARQYVVYGVMWNWAMVLVFAGLTAILYRVLRAGKKEAPHSNLWQLGGGCALPFLVLLVYAHEALLATFAPKVWLLRELAYLIK